jgi:hypothetical protein
MSATWPAWIGASEDVPRIAPNYSELAWISVSVLAVLLGSALIIALVDRWRRRPPPLRPNSRDQLNEFRALYDEGDLSPEEFKQIRALLTERVKQELQAVPSSANAPAPDASAPTLPTPNKEVPAPSPEPEAASAPDNDLKGDHSSPDFSG